MTKLIERRCVALGLNAPQAATLQIIESTAPKESSVDKIERAIRELTAQQDRGNDDPTTH